MLDNLKKRLAWPQQPRPMAAPAADDSPPAIAPPAAAEPAPVANVPPDWTRLRAAPSAKDFSLSPLARAWMDTRPPGAAPQELAQVYPRIVNRLALCWDDPKLALLVLDTLLADKRGGRRGFPLAVDLELRTLQLEATELASQPAKKRRKAASTTPAVPGLELLELEGEPIDPDEDDDGVQWV